MQESAKRRIKRDLLHKFLRLLSANLC